MATFEFLRISLAKESRLPFGEDLNREQFLRAVFSQRWDFTYRKRMYTYDPIQGLDVEVGGIVGREVREIRNTGPDDHWAFKIESNWPLAYVGIEVADTKQIAAFERQGRLGSPINLLQALLDHAVKDQRFDMWSPQVEYIASAPDFWKVAKEFTGRITSLKFVFLPICFARKKP